MQISLKQLLHLPVETKNGSKLGEICGINFDAERHLVVSYAVKAAYLPRPFASELLIAPSQVLSITTEKMVVIDMAIPASEAAPTPA